MKKLIYKFQKGNALKGVLPFDEIVVYPTLKELQHLAAKRALNAKSPNMDFSKALDLTKEEKDNMNYAVEHPYMRYFKGILTYPHNCINSAYYWISGKDSLAKNTSVAKDSSKYNLTKIPASEIQEGDLVLYVTNGVPWHAGVVTNASDPEYFDIVSSNGGSEINPIRFDNLKSDNGKVYYRYTYPNTGTHFIKYK